MVFRAVNIIIFITCLIGNCYSQVGASTPAYINALMEKVADPLRQTGNLDTSLVNNLPIGIAKEINGHDYIIAVDSAFFLNNKAYFNAYTSFDFPGTTEKVAFAAKGIRFNPKGVIGGSFARLMLVSEHIINIGPNTQLILPANGNNYIDWDCNGFQAIHLKGVFRFSKGILIPDSSIASQEFVTASFEIHANDMYNMVVETNISPFKIQGMKDFSFTVKNAVVDLSDFANSPAMVFPAGYTNTYGGNLTLWRGFYLKELIVKLPSELQRNDAAPKTLVVNNMLIDDAGISGIFSGNNLLSLSEGDMHGWGFSVNMLSVGLLANNIQSGMMKGEITLPALDNGSFDYTAGIAKNDAAGKCDYLFSIQPHQAYTMSCFFADLIVFPSSSITVQRKHGKFKPFANLNGKLTIGNPDLSLAEIGFQQLTLITDEPFIANGVFTLSSGGDGHRLANFPIGISELQIGLMNQQPVFGLNVAFNTGDETAGNFSVATNVKVISKVQAQPLAGYNLLAGEPQPVKTTWSFDKLKVDDIHVVVNTQPFNLDGIIGFKNDHPTYGKGFFGNIVLKFGEILPSPVTVAGCFGKTSFRYWSLDAAVPVNAPMPGTPLIITQVRGGISYHMAGSKPNSSLISDIAANAAGINSGQVFTPSQTAGLSFRGGIGFNLANQEKLLNGDVVLGVSFNDNGGLNAINLDGNAYMLVKRSERSSGNNKVYGTIHALFDNVGKIFTCNLNANFDFAGSVNGAAYSKIYVSPDKWYFWLGRPSAPAFINVQNLATVNAYVMAGQELEPMAPPPSYLLNLINNYALNNQRDGAAISNGNGLAVGVNFTQSFDKAVGWDNFEIYGAGSVGAGFDMTMYKYGPNAKCQGSSTIGVGLRNWYLEGRLYAWVGVNAGIRGHALGSDFDVTLLSGNVAMLLEGKLPKPTYVAGYVHIDATALEFIHVNLDFDFDYGNNCAVVNG